MKAKNIYILTAALLLIVLGLLIYANSREPETKDTRKVGATIFALYDATRIIGAGAVDVVRVLPAGQSAHTFDPSPALVSDLAGADAIFKVGLGIDDFADDLATISDPEPKLVEASSGLTLLCGDENVVTPSGAEEDSDDHEGCNPHVWLSARNMSAIVDTITDELSLLYPEYSELFDRNAAAYKLKLQELDNEITALFETKENKSIITFHEAYPYFAEDYGIQIVAAIEPFPGQEPTVQYLKSVSDTIRDKKIKAVFREAELSDAVVSALAADLGVQVKTLDPLEASPDDSSYLAVMRQNAKTIADSL